MSVGYELQMVVIICQWGSEFIPKLKHLVGVDRSLTIPVKNVLFWELTNVVTFITYLFLIGINLTDSVPDIGPNLPFSLH